jgi:hypothetical protein
MKNFKGLHTYAVGGMNTFDFAPGNKATTNMITSNASNVPEAMLGFGDNIKKKANKNNKCKKNQFNCHKPNH